MIADEDCLQDGDLIFSDILSSTPSWVLTVQRSPAWHNQERRSAALALGRVAETAIIEMQSSDNAICQHEVWRK